MINSSLQAFADKVQSTGRISFGDVNRLRRDILPDGISSREEAELLLALDRAVSRSDRSFADWLVAMMLDFVVWGMRPTGVLNTETAGWLAPFLAGREATKAARRLAQELVREAEHVDDALLTPPLKHTAPDAEAAKVNIEPIPLAA